MTRNILVLCHGMTIELEPYNHEAEYGVLLANVYQHNPALEARFFEVVKVEYGHELPSSAETVLRPDEKLTRAQRFIQEHVSYKRVRQNPSAEDEILPLSDELAFSLIRPLTDKIRDTVVGLGLTDAIYYASADGESAVRQTVYGQITDALDRCGTEDEVRLHIVAHSLGSTVLFDFLYGLFAAPELYGGGGEPNILKGAEQDEKREAKGIESRYAYWRTQTERRDQPGRLKLGSLVTLGGQIPFFFMRKQALVDRLAQGQTLDPEPIGVSRKGSATWKIFYDVDDVLGYPVRGLFDAEGSICQYQVNSHFVPHLAHTRYWYDEKVLREIAELLSRTTDSEWRVGLRDEGYKTR